MLAKLIKRRSAIEPEIGHMKADGRLARCLIKGRIGDAIFAVLYACGHNIRKILARIRALLAGVIHLILAIFAANDRKFYSPIAV
jgi:IS5 family transposase